MFYVRTKILNLILKINFKKNKIMSEEKNYLEKNKICPNCGSGTHSYGGTWACDDGYCNLSEYNPGIGGIKSIPWWWNEDVNVYKDGDEWCAVRSNFINLQESIAGFGNTPSLACKELKNKETSFKRGGYYTRKKTMVQKLGWKKELEKMKEKFNIESQII